MTVVSIVQAFDAAQGPGGNDSLSPYGKLKVPYSVREPNDYEPDFTGLSVSRSK